MDTSIKNIMRQNDDPSIEWSKSGPVLKGEKHVNNVVYHPSRSVVYLCDNGQLRLMPMPSMFKKTRFHSLLSHYLFYLHLFSLSLHPASVFKPLLRPPDYQKESHQADLSSLISLLNSKLPNAFCSQTPCYELCPPPVSCNSVGGVLLSGHGASHLSRCRFSNSYNPSRPSLVFDMRPLIHLQAPSSAAAVTFNLLKEYMHLNAGLFAGWTVKTVNAAVFVLLVF